MFEIDFDELALFDQVRQKSLAVRVTYPLQSAEETAIASWPVIVFSHGLLGSKDGYQPLAQYWAQHGYVVVQPTHYDSAAYRKPTLTELRDLTPLFVGWESRPQDILFILDQIDVIAQKLTKFKGAFDHDQIGLGGHSFGSHTAMLIGGAQLASGNFANCSSRSQNALRTPFMDARPKAFLLLSPQGSGRALTESADFDQSAWDNFERPMMIITGTEDNGRRRQNYHWRSEPFKLGAPGDKYLLVINGGYHGFGGITGTRFFGSGPVNNDHVRWVQIATTAFFDCHVKGDGNAAAMMTSGAIVKLTSGDMAIELR